MNNRQLIIMQIAFAVVAMALMFADASAQSRLQRGLGGLGGAMKQSGQMMLDSALQEERQRRLMEQQFQQERELMERRIQQQQALIQQQRQVEQIISEQRDLTRRQEHQIHTLVNENSRLAKENAGLVNAAEELKVYQRHPNWGDTVRTKQFDAWLKRQPQEVQSLAESARGEDAITLLNAYYAQTDKKRRK